MALRSSFAVRAASRLHRTAAMTRVRTRLHRLVARGAAPGRPFVASAELGLDGLDLSGLTVLDAPDGAATADVVVLRDLHRAADPAGAVFGLRERTRVLAVIECPATEWPRHEELGLIEIVAAAPALWSPSADGVRELCLAAGFTDVRIVVGPPAYRRRAWRPVHYRLVVHARP
ncbi:MAG TPA: hypothetical protein VGM33_16045 [Baekduia sp.]|jgi:hypothetical protein